jgi:ABC-type uncharacterized transport system substrate-binding protein
MNEERTMFAVSKSLRAIAGALALSAICASALAAEKVVAITSFVEHPALDAVRDGTKDELIAEGFEPGKNLKWDFQSAQANAGTAGQIAKKFVGDNPDVIVAIGTPRPSRWWPRPRPSPSSTRPSPIPWPPSWSRTGSPPAPT